MGFNEQETRYFLIDPVLRSKGYDDYQWLKLETPAPVEPTGPKGRRRKGPGRTDYLLCVRLDHMPKALPVAVLEAKKEAEDPLKGMQQAKGYADCERFDVKYVFSTNGHRYGEFDCFTNLQGGPFPFSEFPGAPGLDRTLCQRHRHRDHPARGGDTVPGGQPGLVTKPLLPGCGDPMLLSRR